jgi:hypothetical protein
MSDGDAPGCLCLAGESTVCGRRPDFVQSTGPAHGRLRPVANVQPRCVRDELVGALSVALPCVALCVAAGGARCRRQLWRSALRADYPALLASRGRRKTRYAGCARCARTAAASQMTKRAARAPLEAVLLGAPHGARPAHRLPLRERLWCSDRLPAMLVAKGCAGGGATNIRKEPDANLRGPSRTSPDAGTGAPAFQARRLRACVWKADRTVGARQCRHHRGL